MSVKVKGCSYCNRLRKGDRTVNELAEPFAISLQAVSKHIQVLERAGRSFAPIANALIDESGERTPVFRIGEGWGKRDTARGERFDEKWWRAEDRVADIKTLEEVQRLF